MSLTIRAAGADEADTLSTIAMTAKASWGYHPDHMGHGIGDVLLRHAMACARENGADALRIVSDPNAETFYAKYGAERVDMVPSQPEGRELPLLRLPV
jgi:predicted N-acetyltransferase YhbS